MTEPFPVFSLPSLLLVRVISCSPGSKAKQARVPSQTNCPPPCGMAPISPVCLGLPGTQILSG